MAAEQGATRRRVAVNIPARLIIYCLLVFVAAISGSLLDWLLLPVAAGLLFDTLARAALRAGRDLRSSKNPSWLD